MCGFTDEGQAAACKQITGVQEPSGRSLQGRRDACQATSCGETLHIFMTGELAFGFAFAVCGPATLLFGQAMIVMA